MYVGMIVLIAVNLKSHVSSKPDFGIRKNPSILICDIFPAVGSLPGRRTPRCRRECTSTRTVLPPENSGCKRLRYFYILHFTSWRTVDVDCRCENNRKKIAKRSNLEKINSLNSQFFINPLRLSASESVSFFPVFCNSKFLVQNTAL